MCNSIQYYVIESIFPVSAEFLRPPRVVVQFDSTKRNPPYEVRYLFASDYFYWLITVLFYLFCVFFFFFFFFSFFPLQLLDFWNKTFLSPYNPPKDVLFMICGPPASANGLVSDRLKRLVSDFSQDLSCVYETCKLGNHRPIPGFDEGVVVLSQPQNV